MQAKEPGKDGQKCRFARGAVAGPLCRGKTSVPGGRQMAARARTILERRATP